MPAALRAAREIRAVLPNATMVVGDPPPTVRPQDYLAEPATTAVVLGEGDGGRLPGDLPDGRVRVAADLTLRLLTSLPKVVM